MTRMTEVKKLQATPGAYVDIRICGHSLVDRRMPFLEAQHVLYNLFDRSALENVLWIVDEEGKASHQYIKLKNGGLIRLALGG